MDFHYLGSAGAVPRCTERTTRHHFPFLPPCCPMAQYAGADFFLLLQAKKMPLAVTFVSQTLYTAHTKKSCCFKP